MEIIEKNKCEAIVDTAAFSSVPNAAEVWVDKAIIRIATTRNELHINQISYLSTKFVLILFILLGALDLHAECIIRNSADQPASVKGDALFNVLNKSPRCPENVQSLKTILHQTGLVSQPFMVANRGIHNPTMGSFSFFEQMSGVSPLLDSPVEVGEFFFGHFTVAENNIVVADQGPTKGKLLVELIAWDKLKGLFNFYELIGTGTGAQWFYRGDSADILADNSLLYLNPQGRRFGATLRCSACHTSGGPIMKELAAPHNDWWTASRPLIFAPNSISSEISNWVQQLEDASKFSQSVKKGIARLEQSASYQKVKLHDSLQTALRPLFCETEINLESDALPLEQALAIQIPSASIVNPLLAVGSLSIANSDYQQILKFENMQFPETNRRDADHGWLVPVKGYSDLAAIQSLVKNGIVTDEFAADVLAIDFENPLFSSKRCGLVQLVSSLGFVAFPERLKASTLPGANELYENLTNPLRTRSFHMKRAQEFLIQTQKNLNTLDGQRRLFKKLLSNRRAVFDAEISKNPRGQILEPGFRVIFPKSHE